MTEELHNSRKLLQTRPGLPLQDLTPFELASRMYAEGWVCCTKAGGVRAKSHKTKADGASEPLMPEDYSPGQPKRWWLKSSQTSLQASYLRALLSAHLLLKPVPHFMSDRFYECLLSGKE